MDELTIGDKIYISSKRAASITGYAKDYVGQLCREGHVEAKMVGRSWYVLESSIREHRFGKPETSRELNEKESVATEALINATVESLPGTWEAPKYISEEAPKMPEFVAPAPSAPIQTPEEPSEGHESITEMQAAWKEWFESKQELQEPRLETPEVIEAREEAEEPIERDEPVEEAIPIVVHRIPVAPVVERYVQERPVEAPVRPPVPQSQTRRVKRARNRNERGSNLVAATLMLVFAGVVVVIAIVGSGFGGMYLQDNVVVDFLGGTSSINK